MQCVIRDITILQYVDMMVGIVLMRAVMWNTLLKLEMESAMVVHTILKSVDMMVGTVLN